MKKLLFILLLLPVIADAQIITTIAGNGIRGTTGDGGPATAAEIAAYGCAVDLHGNLYFTTPGGGAGMWVRKITPCGIISTVAGIGVGGYNGDGIPATTAELNDPKGIALDSLGNIYIAEDANNRIRKVDAVTDIISTVAGNGTAGYSGDGGPATAAMLNQPGFICFDRHGNLYIIDGSNYRIREVNTSGIISTIAGDPTGPYADTINGVPADSTQIADDYSICTDKIGNVFVGDNHWYRVRKIDTNGIINTIAGNGSPYTAGDGGPAITAGLESYGLQFDTSGNLYISGYGDNDIRKINDAGIIYTVAGNGTAGYSGDGGPATEAEINVPYGIAVDPLGNLYIADEGNNRIRKVTFYPNTLCSSEKINTMIPQNISIYPNPAYNELTITTSDEINRITIYNLIGQTVYIQAYNNNQAEVNIAALPEGMYMVEVTDGNGEKTISKIIKQ